MPSDDIFDLEDLSDDELHSLVRSEFEEYDTLDPDNILIEVKDGHVRLSGRVGTDGERRIAEHVLTDVIGVTDFENRIVVDPIRRDLEPEAADDHVGEAVARGEDQLGGSPIMRTDPAAEFHYEDIEARERGTHDVQEAISEGISYEPPDTPTQEGVPGSEDRNIGELGEEH